jgi:carbamoylphosphate synthase large subunit
MGTPPPMIDAAEDRKKFSQIVREPCDLSVPARPLILLWIGV